jgi:rubrerythrin
MMKRWTLDDIAWDRFEPCKVDPDLLKIAKAASMVERNAHDYGEYLAHIFDDDPEFQVAAKQWAKEEVQHGEALSRWARLADPQFDFDSRFKQFTDKIKLPIGASESVRGSRTGELIARCIVEVGTSSYYTALGSSTDEPVLREICQKIAADEFRHYKLFYTHMKRYQKRERLGFLARLKIAVVRTIEAEDDELAYAYYAANHADDGPYDNKAHGAAYMRRAYARYRFSHIERIVAMMFKAIGIKPYGLLNRVFSRAAYFLMRRKVRRLVAAGA